MTEAWHGHMEMVFGILPVPVRRAAGHGAT